MSVYRANPRHLDLQIRSVLAQDHRDLRLYVTGDGEPIPADPAAYADDGRVAFAAEGRNLGVLNSFVRGVASARGDGAPDYYAFADQDDLWRPDKLSAQLAFMRTSGCILCHTDAEIVDGEGAVVASTMFPHAQPAGRDSFPGLMLYNNVTGMTALLDARFIDAFLIPPPIASVGGLRFFHDWWAALVYAWHGEVGFLPRATVGYRQHGGNVAGVAFRPDGRGGGAGPWPTRLARRLLGGDVSDYADRAALAAHMLTLVDRGVLPRRPDLERHLRARFNRADLGAGFVRDAFAHGRAGDRAARGASIGLAAAKLRLALRAGAR